MDETVAKLERELRAAKIEKERISHLLCLAQEENKLAQKKINDFKRKIDDQNRQLSSKNKLLNSHTVRRALRFRKFWQKIRNIFKNK